MLYFGNKGWQIQHEQIQNCHIVLKKRQSEIATVSELPETLINLLTLETADTK